MSDGSQDALPNSQPEQKNLDPTVLELKRFEVSQQRFHEVFLSIRTLVICVTVTVCVIAICWAVVRIVDKPAWLLIVLAIFGPAGIIAIIFKYLEYRTRVKIEMLRSQAIESHNIAS
jgi:cytochrome bd-type quinol oxidase subunit 1